MPEEDCAIFDRERQWRKANPALGDFRSYEDLAAAMPQGEAHAGGGAEGPQSVSQSACLADVASLISRAEWMACAGEARFEDGEAVYLALDCRR